MVENRIIEVIREAIVSLERPDLFREPLVSFSSAEDERYPRLKTLIGDWHALPEELLPGAKSIVSYFVPFTEEVVDGPRSVQNGSPIWGEAYIVINAYFNEINRLICSELESHGHRALAMKPTHTYDPKELKASWSQRSAAAIAGIGAFGANRMLITEKGCGGRYCSVITTARLKPNTVPAQERCLYHLDGSCGLCFDICPVGALSAGAFEKFVCQTELNRNGALLVESDHIVGADTCGKCISVCPVAYIE